MDRHLTVEDVATYPRPGTAVPKQWAFSPDDAWITYLHSEGGTLHQQLYAYHVERGESVMVLDPADGLPVQAAAPGAGEADLPPEERLRRERTRTRALGVTTYAWAPRGDRLVIPVKGAIYVKDGVAGALRTLVTAEDGPALDPHVSPDGALVAYVQDAELCVVPIEGGAPRRLTTGARATGMTHGLAEYVAQEEMRRARGFWWSKDSARLAFVEVDATHIPVYRIVHQGKDALGDAAQEDHRYPFAGQVNARVRLGVVPAAGGETVWMNLGENPDLYLARVAWWPDGRLVAQIENRAQTVLRVVAFDPATGAPTLLWEETQAVWINLHDMLKPLRDGRFIWASERSGFMHLYLHDAGGRPLHAITEGDWMVESVAGVDEERALVYLTGTRDGPLEAHLYAVPLAGGAPKRLTPAPGTHQVVLDHGKRRFIDTRSDLDQPPVTHLCSLEDGRPRVALYDRPDDRVAALDLTPPEIVTVRSRDGETLYGALYRPVGDAPGPYPVVVSVYGGPHAQRVSRAWSMTVDLRAQYLRRRGVLVFKLDNRGSARRGLAFEGAIKHNLGDVEVRDQVAGLRWLVDQGLADPDRVGVMGWSYGGYVALMCLARAPSHFKAAVAGAPVTHWDGYDTHYTERYMGLPAENSEGYEVSSVMAHVDDIRGRLLLVHGLIDENVHFRHTARLINALIRARKDYDLLLFPDERHMPRGLADRVYMESRILDWLLAVL